ncbi:MAG: hypothetical protein JWP18_2016, partial [Solirubrobacterales bacterium]|nr:hypothetical protein [Solirubrobacterales bacterium]
DGPPILGALTSLFLLRSAATAYAASDPPVALTTGAPVPRQRSKTMTASFRVR